LKLYDNNKLTIVDAVMQIGFPNEKLFPRRGKELNFTINNKARLVRGVSGEGAVVKLNDKLTNLNTEINQNDIIEIVESTVGEPATFSIGQLEEHNSSIHFIVNNKKIICPRFAYVNGELKSEFYSINENDIIQIENYYTVAQLFEFMDYNVSNVDVYVNNELAKADTKVYENFSIRTTLNDEHFSQDYSSLETPDINKVNSNSKDVSNNLTKHSSDTVNNTPIRSTTNTKQAVNTSDTVNTTDIIIIVNQQPVKLTGKKEYILVDLFQFYAFDLSSPKGNIVLKLNGAPGDYTGPIKDGDIVEIYWEK